MNTKNNYIFIMPSICNIGGAQLYLVNKLDYLRKHNWNVLVLYSRKDVILIKELEVFEEFRFEELQYSTCYYRKSHIAKTVAAVSKCIRNHVTDGFTVIESSTVSNAMWAELLASELKCKHICFDFEEVFTYLSNDQLKFLEFKFRREELYGISKKSVPLMFNNFITISENADYSYDARPMPPIQNCDSKYVGELKKYDTVIGSFGRLDKEFVFPTLLVIKEYVLKHTDMNFCVLLIGGTKDKRYKKRIYNEFRNVCDVIITGEMFPVSRALIREVDLFISSSGSAIATAREGVPTITVVPKSIKSTGILNYTTKDFLYSATEQYYDILDLIYLVIDDSYCLKHSDLGLYDNWEVEYNKLSEVVFEKQLIIAKKTNNSNYYNVTKIKRTGSRGLIAVFAQIIGAKAFHFTLKIARKFKGTLVKG